MAKVILTDNQLELITTAIDWALASVAGITKDEDEDLYEYGKRFETLDKQLTAQLAKINAQKSD